MTLPRKTITLPIYLSPLLMAVVLIETFLHQAYPADGDIILIPFISYLIFQYPLSILLALLVRHKKLTQVTVRFWNPRRNLVSLFTLLLIIYPIGLWWSVFLEISIRSLSYLSILICAWMILVIVAVRTWAIQDKP